MISFVPAQILETRPSIQARATIDSRM